MKPARPQRYVEGDRILSAYNEAPGTVLQVYRDAAGANRVAVRFDADRNGGDPHYLYEDDVMEVPS
jgi:hypothetical protein